MALSRISDLLKPYVLNYLDPTGDIRKQPQNIDVKCSKKSLGINNVYTKNKALNMFTNNNDFSALFFSTGEQLVRHCFDDDYRFVHRDDLDHDLYHKTPNDFEIEHTHILKGETIHDDMSLDDVKCLLTHLRSIEKSYGLCLDGEKNCILANPDKKKITEEYQKYTRQKNRVSRLDTAVERISADLSGKMASGAKCFSNAFISTLIDKYFVPLLINQGIQRKTASWSMQSVKSAIALSLSANLGAVAISIIIQNALGAGLTKLGINPDTITRVTSEIGTIIEFTNNPLSLIDLGINGIASTAGQTAAYQVIRALPKLKYEPKATEEHVEHVVSTHTSTSTLNSFDDQLRYRK